MDTDNTEITINSYDNCASSFEDKFSNYAPYRKKILSFHNKYLQKKSTILDVGCGPGNNTKLLLGLNPNYKITGIDLSENMLEIARANLSDCTFIQSDIRNIEAKNRYDAVLASFCIVHLSLKETAKFITTINNILNSNGILYLSFMEGKEDGFEKTSFSEKELYFCYHSKEKIESLLRKNNLEIREITEELYIESNGNKTNEIFIIAEKENTNS